MKFFRFTFCFALQAHTAAGITIIFDELVHGSCGETMTALTIRSSPCAVSLSELPDATEDAPGAVRKYALADLQPASSHPFFRTGHPTVLQN